MQVLHIIGYPLGWVLVLLFGFGRVRPGRWRWLEFFEAEPGGIRCFREDGHYRLSYEATSAVGLCAVLIPFTLWSLSLVFLR